MKPYVVITFNSTHTAMKAEDIFKELKLDFELIPTPREISAECGFALLVRKKDTPELEQICREYQIQFDGIHLVKEKKGVKYYEKNY